MHTLCAGTGKPEFDDRGQWRTQDFFKGGVLKSSPKFRNDSGKLENRAGQKVAQGGGGGG